MQDIHLIGAGVGARTFFAAGTGDRRLKHHQQPLKCPRCQSLNTKFCYYNNYNLSQPRHFCKNCRRYWTIGGVLRNVPVGGGSRKTKRSKPKPTRERKSPSSSDSSTLTATTTEATTIPPVPITPSEVFPSFDMPAFDQLPAGFNMAADVSSFRQEWMPPTENLTADMGFVDLHNRVSDGGAAAEEWRGGVDQDLFDLMGAVDQAYWSQTPLNYHDHDHDYHLN